MTKRIELKIYGIVQGVFFRSFVRQAALRLNLTGFVRNEPDGSVYVVAEGSEDKLRELIDLCHQGPELAKVENIKVDWKEATGEYSGFDIAYNT